MKEWKTRILIRNIGLLVNVRDSALVRGHEMQDLRCISDGAMIIRDGVIEWFGAENELPAQQQEPPFYQEVPFDSVINAEGGMVIPAFCDSHTHLLYPASREQEMADRLNGMSYAEISARGGGILHSARKMERISDEELLRDAEERLDNILRTGTGTVEIKSGYGLSVSQELRMLRLIRKLKERSPLTICATFLGAHAFPPAYQEHPDQYVEILIGEMIPQVAEEGLAEFVDVFCEKGFFSVAHTERILESATRYGLKPRLHTNQFTHSGGILSAIRHHALSVDHLEVMNEHEIALLTYSSVIPTLLPGCAFFMDSPYPPARAMIDAGLPVALASDFNPGTNPSGDMKFVLSLACLKMKLTVAEALQAATLNGAAALGLGGSRGSIAVGKRADLMITRPLASPEMIPYAYTDPMVRHMMLGGAIMAPTTN